MIDQKALSQYYHAFTSTTDSSIAQPVEQRTVNPCVPGSSPGRGANNIKPTEMWAFFRLFILTPCRGYVRVFIWNADLAYLYHNK